VNENRYRSDIEETQDEKVLPPLYRLLLDDRLEPEDLRPESKEGLMVVQKRAP